MSKAACAALHATEKLSAAGPHLWSPEQAGRAPPSVTPLRAREAPLRRHRPPQLLRCAPSFPLPLLHVRSPLGRVNTQQRAKLAEDHVRAPSSMCAQNATTALTEQPHCRPSQLFPSASLRLAAAAPRPGAPCPPACAPGRIAAAAQGSQRQPSSCSLQLHTRRP